LHGKKPKESLKRQAKPAPKRLVPTDVVKAVRHRDWPTVRQALIEKIDPDAIQVHGDPLILAVTACAPVRVVQAVLKAGADPDAPNGKRETALFHASDPKIVELLLAAGANPNHRSKAGTTPLHRLAAKGLPHGLELLILAGAQLEALDDERRTPLLRAAKEQKPDAVEVLLRHRADPEARTRDGLTALHEMARQRTKAAEFIVAQLLAAGADVAARSLEQQTPLMFARVSTVALALVSAAADVNATTPDGATALHYAIARGDVDVVRVLAQAKADVDLPVATSCADRALAGKTPRELAAANSLSDMRRLFRSA
jgi:cytohesin